MWYRPRGLLFWLLLIVLLFIIATAPVELAHAVAAVYQAIEQFFINLSVFLRTLTSQ